MNNPGVVLLKLFSRLPLAVTHLLGWILGIILYLIPNQHRAISRKNILLCFPDRGALSNEWLLFKSLIETSKTLFETAVIWFSDPKRFDQLTKEVVGEAVVNDAIDHGKGVLIIGPHLGSWELVSLYCSRHYNITSLYRPLRFNALEDEVKQARQKFGANLVPTSTRGVKALFNTLAENRFVGIPPDQDPRDNGGVFAPFFNISSNTMSLLPRLYQKSGASPILAVAERLSWGRGFKMHFIAINDLKPNQTTEQLATSINLAVENAIRQFPYQYQWSYKRFRTRPDGKKPFYP